MGMSTWATHLASLSLPSLTGVTGKKDKSVTSLPSRDQVYILLMSGWLIHSRQLKCTLSNIVDC